MQDYTVELVDLVNESDEVIITCARSAMEDFPKLYLRVVLTFLKSAEGKLCILRRADSKQYLPSCWALVGGGVHAGESYECAIIRETAEEINLAVNETSLNYLGLYKDSSHKFMKYMFEITLNAPELKLNFDDFSEYRWLLPEEILQLEAQGEKFCPDLIHLINTYYPTTKIEAL